MLLNTIRQKFRTSTQLFSKLWEASWRVAGKVIVLVLKEDVIKYTGRLQVCARQEVGIEAAIHSMNMTYEDDNTNAIWLADAKNVFNSLNR